MKTKLLIIGLCFTLLVISGTLLMRGLHQWTAREKLKKAIFAVTLSIVFVVLVFAGEAALQWPEAGVPLAIFAAFSLFKAYESGENSRWSAAARAEKTHKITKEQWILGLSCAVLPAGGFGLTYLMTHSLRKCVIWTFIGFLAASIVMMFGIWRMEKKEKS